MADMRAIVADLHEATNPSRPCRRGSSTYTTVKVRDLSDLIEDWHRLDNAWRRAADRVGKLKAERDALLAERDRPETEDFMRGVVLEAQHQRARWGSDHDAGKTPFDWFWLVGFLAQKAADAAVRAEDAKAKHHTISTAAALANWHLMLSSAAIDMRPGIDPPAALAATGGAS